MIRVNLNYKIKETIELLMEAEGLNSLEMAEKVGVSRNTLDEIFKKESARSEVYEKVYSYAYANKYRINAVREEIIKEKHKTVLFHGSKEGLKDITPNGARDNCDFGNGFYLGETYQQALSFVCDKENSSVYSFSFSLDDLSVKRFECDLDWMIAICYYRGTLKDFRENERVKKIVSDIEKADVVIAPIADNKMFYIMAQFMDGDINADVALHSLSASRLGLQYILKTEKAIKKLKPLEKFYLCQSEREDCRNNLIERSYEIDTKLKVAKREFRNGLYIEELLR